MLGNSSPRISLYSFFSVLLPGVVFILGLSPFLPSNISIGSAGLLLPILAVGFALGQAVHTVAVSIENSSSKGEEIDQMRKEAKTFREVFKLWFYRWFVAAPLHQLFGEEYFADTSHRNRFVQELDPDCESEILDDDVCDSFYRVSRDTFPELELPKSRDNLFDESSKKCAKTRTNLLYGNVRSVVHIDGRGRSRSFQAIYSFCRSMWIVSIILFLIYSLYSILSILGVPKGLVSYVSHIGKLEISSIIIAAVAFVIAVGSFKLFKAAKRNYQQYYIQYMVSDFLILQNDEISSGQQIDLSHSFDEEGSN